MTVTAYQDLPLAERDAEWDPAAAEQRVREWAEVEAKAHLGCYYARMRMTPPWDTAGVRALGVGAGTN